MHLLSKKYSRYAFLDRDGTILVDKVYLSNPEDIELILGVIEGLKLLQDRGVGLIIVTNQSGIARGYFDVKTLENIHFRLLELLRNANIFIEAIYYCPHGPNDNCYCLKPRPGMILEALKDLKISAKDSIFIGDTESDMVAAKAAGVICLQITGEEGLQKGKTF